MDFLECTRTWTRTPFSFSSANVGVSGVWTSMICHARSRSFESSGSWRPRSTTVASTSTSPTARAIPRSQSWMRSRLSAHTMQPESQRTPTGLFPRSAPPRDRTQRQYLLDSLGPEQRALLESLDEEFYRYPDNLTELLYGYVKRNSTDIPAAVDVGI